MECKRRECRTKECKIKPTLNVKITLDVNCLCQQNQEQCPAQHYLYFVGTFKKWDHFCLNGHIYKDQKIILI